MADEFLKTWHEYGNNLKESVNKLLKVGDACINQWESPKERNDKYNCLRFENTVLKYFDEIDENALNMQKCIINVLRYLSYTRRQLEERIDFKNKHSKCQTTILDLQQHNMKLQEKIENEEKKCQMLVQKIQETKKVQHCAAGDQTIETIYWYKEQEIQNLNREIGNINLENKYLKQKLKDVTEDYKSEIKNLQNHLSECEEKFEQIRLLHDQNLCKVVNVKNMATSDDNCTNDIIAFEESFACFVELYKKLATENQNLRLKMEEYETESDSTEEET